MSRQLVESLGPLTWKKVKEYMEENLKVQDDEVFLHFNCVFMDRRLETHHERDAEWASWNVIP